MSNPSPPPSPTPPGLGSPAVSASPSLAEPLWDVPTLAAFLHVSRSWVYQRVEAGALPCVHLGAAVRFVPDDIRAWLRGERGGQVVRLRDYVPRRGYPSRGKSRKEG